MLNKFIRKDKQFLLNFAAVVGVGLTMATAIRDTTKACKLIDEKMSNIEKIKRTWRCYIPSGSIALTTMLCIIYSDYTTMNQKVALLQALTAAQNRYSNLRNSVDISTSPQTRDEILKKAVKQNVPKDIYIDRTGEKIFYEEYTCKFFTSTIDNVLKAEYMFNKQLSIVGHATLNDFYKMLGIKGTEAGEYLGWSVYDGYYGASTTSPWVDFEHSKMEDDEGVEYYHLNYSNQPIVNYDMFS
jgi:hypothetical protein